MIDIKKIRYRLVAIDTDSTQYDLSEICSGLNWSEGEKELACKINFKVAALEELSHLQPMTPIIIYADLGEGWQECVRGNIQKMTLTESNSTFSLDVEAADNCQALRQSQDDFFFTDGHTSSAILKEILDKWGVPSRIEVQDSAHAKKVYRGKFLADMISDVLKDLKEKDGGVYFVRSREGVIEIIPRGTNDQIFSFDVAENVLSLKDVFDASKMATRVQVVAKDSAEGKQRIESTIDGKTEFGTRQRIYYRSDKETLAEAETAAKKLLDESGLKRDTTLEAPDLPTLRKGDRIRLTSSLGTAYFFVKSIRHNAAQSKMTLSLNFDNEKSEAYDLAWLNEGSEF